MSQEDISLDEKRIYGDARETTVAYVASGIGLARVEIAGDRAGRMSLVHGGTINDVAGGGGYLLVATDEDVLIGTGEGLDSTDFGPGVAVGVGEDRLVAAGPDGEIARLAGDDWETLGTLGDVRTIDGDYLVASDSVVRIDADGLTPFGLDGVRDVAAAGPYAATVDGLYRLTDGEWRLDREGACDLVAAGGGVAHLVADDELFERVGDEWFRCALPVEEAVVDVAYAECPYAVTAEGTFLIDADSETTADGSGGWRFRSLGIPNVRALAIP